MKTFSKGLLAAAVLAASATTATVAHAEAELEVGASVGVSNFYLWRGQDLGNGAAQVWGDLSATYGGAYGGIWASSGDDALGNEYDLYAGYGSEVLGLTYDVSVWSYNYPDTFAGESTNFADLTDGILTIGYGPVSYTHIKTIAGGSGTAYQSYDLALGDFTLTYGDHKAVDTEDHFSIAYGYNDNLTFTAVFPLEPEDATTGSTSDPLFNVALSLPIE
jgi:uncharacterized protein (TIGR02001 family)